ncbi:MAG: PepSY-associated TM helix domain-containing protein [Pseudomonadota bacterium]
MAAGATTELRKRSAGSRSKLWTIHAWVGFYAGIVIAALSLTGVAALFKEELDRALNPQLFSVAPAAVTVDIAERIEAVRSEHGPEHHSQTFPPLSPTETWRLRFLLRKRFGFEQIEVFIDPYSGRILGERDYTRTLAYFLRQVHVRLYESVFGRQIVGIAGIALLVSTVTGLLIYGRFMKKQFFAAVRSKNIRVKMADWHKLIGVATLAFNLMVAITGAWLGLQVYLQPLVLDARPGGFVRAEKPLTAEVDIATAVDYPAVMAASQRLFPELVPRFLIPSRDGSRTVGIRGDVPGQAYERNSFSLTLDKTGLEELHRYDIRAAGFGDKLFYVQEAVHFGDYGGLAMKFVYSFFGLTSGFLSLAGFVVYLERTQKRRREARTILPTSVVVWRWTGAIVGTCVLLAIMQLNLGPVVPAMLVLLAVYGSLLFFIVRGLYRSVRARLVPSTNA